MDCIYCSGALPDSGFFCPNCAKQFKCKNCSSLLIKDAIICIECGEEVRRKINASFNTIDFSETRSTRTFKAAFTDTIGNNISEAFGVILANRISGTKIRSLNGLPPAIDSTKTEDVVAEILDEKGANNPEIDQLKKIIKIDNDKATLVETRLKAKSKRDYAIRLAIIFLYHKYLLGVESVPRRDLTTIVDSASVEDGNFRFWLANNPQIGIDGDFVQIKAPGIELARTYVSEIFSAEAKDKWQIGTQSRAKKTKDKSKNEKSK